MKQAMLIGVTLSLLGLGHASNARADEWDKKTVLTFSQSVEIPGHVLPAGSYTFKLADSMSDRHIVQVFNADGTKIIATIMTIPDYRLKPTDLTVIKFGEMPIGSPEVVRAWFYPGNTLGQEFVYPKKRALQLAKAGQFVVPAMPDGVGETELRTVSLVAITPEEKEVTIAEAIQTTAPVVAADHSSMMVATSGVKSTGRRHLPKTASNLPLIALLGFGALGAGLGLMLTSRRSTAFTL